MAELCSNVRRNKCSGWQRGLHCGSWKWFVLIIGLTNLPCLLARRQNVVNKTFFMYPKGQDSLRYGESLEILCVDENSSDLEFLTGTTVLPSEIVNSTTRRLYFEKPEKQVKTYSCKNKKTLNTSYYRVLIDSPPENVTDFACKSKNLEVLNCTWTSPERYSWTNYSITFLINGNALKSLNATREGNLRYCSWTTNSEPRYRQMEKSFYFRLTAWSVFGRNVQHFEVDHISIIEPDPPFNLKVHAVYNHSVLLRWKIPINLNLLRDGVDHRIEYQIGKIDNTAHFRSVDASSLPSANQSYRFLLTNLPYAHMQYEVRIYIRCKSKVKPGLWSKFAFTVFYTGSERPNRPPDTVVGAFGQAVYQNKRLIYIYWKQLEEYEEAGTNFTYKVVATQQKRKPQTILADKNKSLSYVVLENASLGAIDVSIWSVNDNGSSINSSYLYIPPEINTRLKVSSFTKLAYENGTYKLSWGGVDNIDNYTVFWCIHNTTGICSGRMNFTVLNPNTTTYVINLPKENRYQFAISTNSGNKTSGMVWANCDISKDSIQMYGFPVKMDHDAPGPSFVKITWTMDCTLQEGVITGYRISYCPALATTNSCVQTKNETTINITNPKLMAKNITNLEPYTTYLFTLAMNTTYGLKLIENASTGVTTTEDTPTSPVNITISDIEYDSVNISWDPPEHRNGIIGNYKIYNVVNNDFQEFYVDTVSNKDKDDTRRHVKVTGLNGFTNYSWTVEACNIGIGKCSKVNPSDAIFVRTKIGPPGKMKTPTITSRPDKVKWEPPEIYGGPIGYYQLKRNKDGSTDTEIFNTTNLEYSLTHCDGGVGGETYRVRAISFDENVYYGTLSVNKQVILPYRNESNRLEHPGEWSDASSVACGTKDGLMMTFILMAVFASMGLMYSSIKCYKKYRKMEDIKPVLPNGLGVPEKDISKYAFGAWNPSNKDEKPSSDEMLLLPNSRTTVSTSDIKQKENDNCASSDHTDSTALSDTSRAPVDRQVSTSDDGSNSSLHLEAETVRVDDNNTNQEFEDSSNSDTEASRGTSPYFGVKNLKKNPYSGYVQQSVPAVSGYVQSAPMPVKSTPTKTAIQNPSSSYVMAALSTPIFTTGVAPPSVTSNIPVSTGYVRAEDVQMKTAHNFPKLGPSPTKMFGPESLPTMPTLPTPAKHGADSSYIQLQSLDTLPSHKQPVRNTVPLKPQASSGYVSPGDAVINKHLNNMLSGGQIAEESAILDPTMSPDAYCRFSWSTDPANDNLHSLLADSPRINSLNK